MKSRCLLLRLFSMFLLSAGNGAAQDPLPSEYQLKAAFLYHFAQFTEWPERTFAKEDSPLVIGVLGENPFGRLLEQTLQGKVILNHPITAKTVSSVTEATNECHILFVSSSEKKRFSQICAELKPASVLTVGEADRFTEAGGMVNFVRQGNKIRFQINDAAARAAGLRIRSKLLSLGIPAS